MKLELDWMRGDGPSCIVSPCAWAWCFRQADWPRKVRDLRIHHPAVPLFCDWLRRVARYERTTTWDRRRELLGDGPPTAFIPEFRWASRDQKPILLALEENAGGCRAATVLRVEGSELAVRFEPCQAVYLLSLLEGTVLWWEGFQRLWESFRPLVSGRRMARGNHSSPAAQGVGRQRGLDCGRDAMTPG
jgi:hypothetical protein